ncbi:hypothetical protein AJ88_15405 [Mesorhizobium amorphae CCBAU 01583]|nr:hypothetical protein AJ88_15405 [Mesorhizobium amorphae CCBAU 01583]
MIEGASRLNGFMWRALRMPRSVIVMGHATTPYGAEQEAEHIGALQRGNEEQDPKQALPIKQIVGTACHGADDDGHGRDNDKCRCAKAKSQQNASHADGDKAPKHGDLL